MRGCEESELFLQPGRRYLEALNDGYNGGRILAAMAVGPIQPSKVFEKLEAVFGQRAEYAQSIARRAVPETAITNTPHWNPAGSD